MDATRHGIPYSNRAGVRAAMPSELTTHPLTPGDPPGASCKPHSDSSIPPGSCRNGIAESLSPATRGGVGHYFGVNHENNRDPTVAYLVNTTLVSFVDEDDLSGCPRELRYLLRNWCGEDSVLSSDELKSLYDELHEAYEYACGAPEDRGLSESEWDDVRALAKAFVVDRRADIKTMVQKWCICSRVLTPSTPLEPAIMESASLHRTPAADFDPTQIGQVDETATTAGVATPTEFFSKLRQCDIWDTFQRALLAPNVNVSQLLRVWMASSDHKVHLMSALTDSYPPCEIVPVGDEACGVLTTLLQYVSSTLRSCNSPDVPAGAVVAGSSGATPIPTKSVKRGP